MRIETVRRRRRPLSLTSLIDVIFLLLLFFMLTSTFSRYAEIPVSGGRAGMAAGAEAMGIIVQLDAAGGWTLNGQTVGDAELAPEFARLAGLGATGAVLLPRSAVSTQTLVDGLETLRRATALPITLAR
ncbi:biopolymer transporter ExbD [Arsenicitalea aurantiaca]|uniref:Biopolymer transporter ExbD n=1 Tax=Arsenicitalea aurantiaca TaxID=1783274 RepID=A0A433XKH5_9HYPH|nr:biopolymer transporter ExbD [Arsenicitalea aurantiaca]RUT34580.1 biopolymer transporter ExbD [Arsenicitalea aurantiaca]